MSAASFNETFEPSATPPAQSFSQDELIAKFTALDARAREVNSERREIAFHLAGLALENKGQQNTVHLSSSGGQRVKVEFGTEYEYDTEQMLVVAELLGKAQFDELFETKVEFKARKRNLKLFMNTVHASEQLETGKLIIKDATTVKDKTPYVTIEKS
jgi:hypothetical protein